MVFKKIRNVVFLIITLVIDLIFANFQELSKWQIFLKAYFLLSNELINLFTVLATVETMAIALDVFLFGVMNSRLFYLKIKTYIKKSTIDLKEDFLIPIILIPTVYVFSAWGFLLTTMILSMKYMKRVFCKFYEAYNLFSAKDDQIKIKEISLIENDLDFEKKKYDLLKEAIQNGNYNKDEEYLSALYEQVIKNLNIEECNNKYFAILQLISLFYNNSKVDNILYNLFQSAVNRYDEKNNEIMILEIASFIELQDHISFINVLKNLDIPVNSLSKIMKSIGLITLYRHYLIDSSLLYMAIEKDSWNYKIVDNEAIKYQHLLLEIADCCGFKLEKEDFSKEALYELSEFYERNRGYYVSVALSKECGINVTYS